MTANSHLTSGVVTGGVMAGGYIPTPRQPTAIEADFRRECGLRDAALTQLQYDVARRANQRIDVLLDEYLRSAQAVDNPADT